MTDPGPRFRRGRLLVASPSLHDPNFRRTVVLMLEHSDEGALGLVLNRPSPMRVADALPDPLGSALPPDDVVFLGGPVETSSVIVLADFLDPGGAMSLAVGSVGVVDPDDELATLMDRVRTVRAFGGYAGWAGGQLESEIAEEAWIDALARPEDVFTERSEDLWAQVLDRKGGAFRLVARMPEDPGLN